MTNLSRGSVERGWAVLSPPRLHEFNSYPLEVEHYGEPFRIALDGSGGRHLLVPAGAEVVQADSKPAALATALRRLIFDGRAASYVDVSCVESELFAEFDDVVADVIEAASASEQPAGAAIAAVTRWRRLFRSALQRGLSRTAKLGLFAELTVLSALVDADPHFPVSAWRGPLNAPHDFEMRNRCIEVKAVGASSDEIVVHGLEQLETHDGRQLDLLLLRVTEDPDGQSLTDLAVQLISAVATPSDLQVRLARAGFAVVTDRADADAFVVSEVLQIVVGDQVPRIVASSLTAGGLPAGVRGMSYRLEVDALLPHVMGASLPAIAKEVTR